MDILKIQSFSGRNIYSHRPVIRMELDIGNLYNTPTKDIQGFNRKLTDMLPGLLKHKCSRGYEGGFAERLSEGTYIGHVTEHVILELQNMMGYEVCFGKTRVAKEPSLYFIVFEYKNERCAIECARAAVDITRALANGEDIGFDSIIENIKKITCETELGPSTRAILDEAVKRGIPVMRLGNGSILQLGTGRYSRLIQASLTDTPSCISVDIACNKHLTKQILMEQDIPVPVGDIAYSEESAVSVARSIGFPVVVKPFDGNQGKGVTIRVTSESEVREAYREAVKFSNHAIVERFINGRDYRILVIGGKVTAVAERRPPQVVGDGVRSIKELIEIENGNSLRGDDHEKPLTRIKLDNLAKQVLSRKNLYEDYVPVADETISLRDNSNLSTGGTARDCTGEIHPYNSGIAIKAVKSLGLDIAGIDMTIEDISVPLNKGNGAIIEVNAAPGLRMHIYPSEGEPRNVAADIINMMFEEGRPHSIPIISVTGTNGKTTTTRLIAHTIAMTGKKVGMTSTSGIFIGGKCILKGDNTGPISAKMVLSNKETDAAVLETARGGIIRKGLGYDTADVGVITNISDDHLGLDGINTIEDLAFAKSLVAEAVKPDGYAVLNADDAMTEYMLQRVKSKVILFSRESNNPMVNNHVKSGGKAVYAENGKVYINSGDKKVHLIDLLDIPITFNGQLECNIEDSLAAICAMVGINMSIDIIRKGLRTFSPDMLSNPGRFNIFDLGDFKVMLDYGHNPAGYNEVVKFIQKFNAKRLIGVIGVPGDRLDKSIKEVGKLCGKSFSKLYIKEDNDLRGRNPGEVAELLYDSAIKGGAKSENTDIIYSEIKALEAAILDAQPGDLITMFYEEFEPAVELIEKFRTELEHSTVQTETVMEQSAG